jgi:hypothetical protein
VHRHAILKWLPGHRESRWVAIGEALSAAIGKALSVALVVALLVGCGACEHVDHATVFETCCALPDPRACALDRLEPGEGVELTSCNLYVEREALTRWDLAMELASLACVHDERYWCAGELARTLCPHKLDPWCEAHVEDWRAVLACRADTWPGAPVPDTCRPLFVAEETP